MNRFQTARVLHSFLRDESGATAIEYALIAGGIASAIAATITLLGTSVETTWKSVGGIFK